MATPHSPDVHAIMHWRRRVGRSIRTARKSRKLTQGKVSQELGWARTTIVAIENGTQATTLDQLVRLAILFRCGVTGFFPLGVIPPDDLAKMEGPSRLL